MNIRTWVSEIFLLNANNIHKSIEQSPWHVSQPQTKIRSDTEAGGLSRRVVSCQNRTVARRPTSVPGPTTERLFFLPFWPQNSRNPFRRAPPRGREWFKKLKRTHDDDNHDSRGLSHGVGNSASFSPRDDLERHDGKLPNLVKAPLFRVFPISTRK